MDKKTETFIQEYGLAFIAFNKLERVLELIVRKKGRLECADSQLKDKIFERATLGQKIYLANPFIQNRKLITEIEKLRGYRNDIAHKDLKIIHGEDGNLTGASIECKDLFEENNFLIKARKLATEISYALVEELEKD